MLRFNVKGVSVARGSLTSAGVFDSSGNLVRTLWSAQRNYQFSANPVAAWDGTLDSGSVAPTGSYDVRMIDSEVEYTWEGAIGNTSPDHSNVSISGPALNVFTGYHAYGGNINDLAITAAGEMYFVTGYDERMHTYHVATTANPQYANGIEAQGFRSTFTAQLNCCTDGTNAYFHWWDSGGNSNENAVWAVNCATKARATFSATPNPAFLAEYGTAPGKFIFGIGVQQSGNYLFVARAETPLPFGTVWSIWTCHKTTGATLAVNTLGLPYQGRLCVDPVTGNPWIAYLKETATASSTWDRASSSTALTFSNGDLTVANNAANAVYCYSAGTGTKVYFEVVQNQNTGGTAFANPIGVANSFSGRNGQGFLGFDNDSVAFYGNSSWARSGANGSETTPAFGVGDNIGIAVDAPNKLIWMRVNGGNWNNSGTANPATGTGGLACPTLGSPIVAALGFDVYNNVPPNSILTAKFASSSWTYAGTAPAGFSQIPGVTRTPSVAKLNFDGSGNLTLSGVEVTTGLTGASAGLAISPDGSTLLVADSGTQQIKAFNTSNGSVKSAFATSGALGESGGYANGPAVSNTRYMFASNEGFSGAAGWIAYAPDGSFWFCDAGNFRYLHFSSGNSPTYIEQIGYIPSFYSSWVCRNDPTRVFGAYLEYEIDYSLPLAPGNGSWTLVNNWGFGVPGGTGVGNFGSMRWTITGTNGRTYVAIQGGIYELTSTGYRNTGVSVNFDYIDNEFNLWAITGTPSGGNGVVLSGDQGQFFKNAFNGFDGSNNPTWVNTPTVRPAALDTLTAVLPPLFPEIEVFNNTSMMVERTANGTIPVFNVRAFPTGPNFAIQSHFGGVAGSSGALKFTTHPSTNANFTGTGPYGFFPPVPVYAQGALAAGNGLTDAGGGFQTFVPGTTDVFTCYRGESWGNNQVFFWYHWDESGLLINRTGCAAPYFGTFENSLEPNNGHYTSADLDYLDPLPWGPPANNLTFGFMGTPGLAGNVACGGVALDSGNYYLYNADEWYHGGISRWKVSNTDTIQRTSTPVAWNSGSYTPPAANPYNFLAGLPYDTSPLVTGAGGWTRTPLVDDTSGPNRNAAPWLQILTNRTIVDRHLPPDISLEATSIGPAASISYSWTRAGTGNWSITGTIAHVGGGYEYSPVGQRKYCYFTVLDNIGKVIIRFEFLGGKAGPGYTMWINLTTQWRPQVASGDVWGRFTTVSRPVRIVADVTAGTMAFTYADLTITGVTMMDPTADITRPTTFMFTHDPTQFLGQASTCFTNISAMQFADL